MFGPKPSIETITDFREIPLKMFFGYSPVGTSKYRFCISNKPVGPWKKFHAIFGVPKHNPIVDDAQFIRGGLIAAPPVCPNSLNQWYNFFLRKAQPPQNRIDSLCRSILYHKSMGKPRMLLFLETVWRLGIFLLEAIVFLTNF